MKKIFLSVVGLILLTGCLTSVQGQWTISTTTLEPNSVVQYKRATFTIDVTGAFNNPYDGEEIRLDLILTAPSGALVIQPCYFESGNAAASVWKARFTPREPGQYSYKAELRINNALQTSTVLQSFNVSSSAYDGFVQKKNNWAFQFDSGKPFRGIGENIAWEARVWENQSHTYDYFLPKLAAHGGNFLRTWMCVWNLPLEWKKVGDTDRYTDSNEYLNPSGIQRMDEFIELAETNNVYVMLALDWHGALQTGNWWNIHNYNSINGGPATSPAEFFSSTEAKAKYKNRLRYIVARWGYSTSIGAWEFFNEVDNAVYNGTENTIAIPHNVVTQWHTEMSAYLKSIDPYDHLITTSISHREIAGLNTVPDIDFHQRHMYKVTGTIPTTLNTHVTQTGKPYVIGEFGYDWDWNNINNSIGPQLDYDFKRGLWYGLFSPTPVLPMSWWWEFFDGRGTDAYFNSVREISDKMLLLSNGTVTQVATTSPVISLETFAVQTGSAYFIYLLNNSSNMSNDRTITAAIANGTYGLQVYDPEARTYAALGDKVVTGNTLSLSSLSFTSRQSKIIIVVPQGATGFEQLPYQGNAWPVPGKIEAENFDTGAESIAYHDLESSNTDGQYRLAEGVDIETCSEGGFNVTNIVEGEWMEYSVEVVKTGVYTVSARVAAAASGKSFQLEMDGVVIGQIEVPITGSNQTWATVSFTSDVLTAGTHTLKFTAKATGFAFNFLQFTLLNEAPLVSWVSPAMGTTVEMPITLALEASAADTDGSITKVEFYEGTNKIGEALTTPYVLNWTPAAGSFTLYAKAIDNMGLAGQSLSVTVNVNTSSLQKPFPFENEPHLIPGKTEAENFDQGAEGISYHDLTTGNTFSVYRNTDVDMETCTDAGGGVNLADIQGGEWVEYTIQASGTGKYDFYFRVATQVSGQSFGLQVDEKIITANILVPNTGSWQTWQDVKVPNVSIEDGEHVLRFNFNTQYFNLNYFTAAEVVITDSELGSESQSFVYPNPAQSSFRLVTMPTATSLYVVSMQGAPVYYQAINQMDEVHVDHALSPGVYMLNIQHTSGRTENLKLIITQ